MTETPEAQIAWRTANQLVAYNLRRARWRRGWTLEHVGERLEPYIGARWSRASLSAAESSWMPGRKKREFDANELLAFCRVFELPLAWFFLPPEPGEGATEIRSHKTSPGVSTGQLPDVFLLRGRGDLHARLAELSESLPDETQGKLTKALAVQSFDVVRAAIQEAVSKGMQLLEEGETP